MERRFSFQYNDDPKHTTKNMLSDSGPGRDLLNILLSLAGLIEVISASLGDANGMP